MSSRTSLSTVSTAFMGLPLGVSCGVEGPVGSPEEQHATDFGAARISRIHRHLRIEGSPRIAVTTPRTGGTPPATLGGIAPHLTTAQRAHGGGSPNRRPA